MLDMIAQCEADEQELKGGRKQPKVRGREGWWTGWAGTRGGAGWEGPEGLCDEQLRERGSSPRCEGEVPVVGLVG